MEDDDPRGVGAPPDPHGDSEEGVGHGGHYDTATRDANHCKRCGDMIRPTETHCQRCRGNKIREEAGHQEPPSEYEGADPVDWTFQRVGVAVVEAGLDLTAVAKGKAALKRRDDLPTLPVQADTDDTVDGVDDIDGEPHEVLQGDWPPLQEAVELDTEHGKQIAETALNKHESSDSPTLYDETGTPLQDISTVADLNAVVDDGAAWVVPAFLYSASQNESESEPRETGPLRAHSRKMLLCMQSNDKTVHEYQTDEDGMDFWECRDCGKWRPGPSPRKS